jgi:AcrR family transcriptional regulator
MDPSGLFINEWSFIIAPHDPSPQVSPRPRSFEDADILAAVGRVLGRHGPAKFTLGLVAREVGMSAATLVQRFGSKRKLLVTALKGGAGDWSLFIAGAKLAGESPLAIVRALLLCFAEMAPTAREFGNHLAALLLLDLADPAVYPFTRDLTRRNHQALVGLLREAELAGELLPGDQEATARLLTAVTVGSLVQWAIYREGPASDWLARDLDRVLAPTRS